MESFQLRSSSGHHLCVGDLVICHTFFFAINSISSQTVPLFPSHFSNFRVRVRAWWHFIGDYWDGKLPPPPFLNSIGSLGKQSYHPIKKSDSMLYSCYLLTNNLRMGRSKVHYVDVIFI